MMAVAAYNARERTAIKLIYCRILCGGANFSRNICAIKCNNCEKMHAECCKLPSNAGVTKTQGIGSRVFSFCDKVQVHAC